MLFPWTLAYPKSRSSSIIIINVINVFSLCLQSNANQWKTLHSNIAIQQSTLSFPK